MLKQITLFAAMYGLIGTSTGAFVKSRDLLMQRECMHSDRPSELPLTSQDGELIFRVEEDGVARLKNSAGDILWYSHEPRGTGPWKLCVKDDSIQIELQDANGEVLFTGGVSNDDFLQYPDYEPTMLELQNDKNLVLYSRAPTVHVPYPYTCGDMRPLWSSQDSKPKTAADLRNPC